MFVHAHRAPHATQKQEDAADRHWSYKQFSTNDRAVRQHLTGKQALALNARWYPRLVNLDIDEPSRQAGAVFDRLLELGITRDQFVLVSTPRYRKNGNFRAYLKTELHGKPATAGLNQKVLAANFECEFNPNGNKVDRLPLSFDSEILDTDTHTIKNLTLQQKIEIFENLTPVEISALRRVQTIPAAVKVAPLATSGRRRKFVEEAEALKQYGLQSGDNRHEAQSKILFLLWLRGDHNNLEAIEFTKNWIRTKHNGHSNAVNRADWQRIDGEIERQAKSVFALVAEKFPDAVHNKLTSPTAADVADAAKFAPADAAKQKQFFKLLGVIRPVFHHEWITIRAERWRDDIASDSTYIDFQQELESRGLMIPDKHYIIGSKTRKYKFNFKLPAAAPLSLDGRNIDNYYEALKMVCRGDQREIHSLTGINRMTLWRNLKD